ncbi:unnamed protein product [Amoebophrya sp. A25]|nr:unnamed protein product [Amoebophrya sp. A25]|eukprot:GSA25T00016588001.1
MAPSRGVVCLLSTTSFSAPLAPPASERKLYQEALNRHDNDHTANTGPPKVLGARGASTARAQNERWRPEERKRDLEQRVTEIDQRLEGEKDKINQDFAKCGEEQEEKVKLWPWGTRWVGRKMVPRKTMSECARYRKPSIYDRMNNARKGSGQSISTGAVDTRNRIMNAAYDVRDKAQAIWTNAKTMARRTKERFNKGFDDWQRRQREQEQHGRYAARARLGGDDYAVNQRNKAAIKSLRHRDATGKIESLDTDSVAHLIMSPHTSHSDHFLVYDRIPGDNVYGDMHAVHHMQQHFSEWADFI